MNSYCSNVSIFLFLVIILPILHGFSFHSLPTSLRFHQVSQSYPSSLWRTLTSSVPKREFALSNITLEVKSELLQILGASSSGKSTILRLVLKKESPISGIITWKPSAVLPIYLQQAKSPYAYESSKTVETILVNLCGHDADSEYWKTIVTYVCEIVGLDTQEVTPSELSPSNLYRLGLVCASLESILPAIPNKSQQNTTTTIPSPLLLLDEWLDLETSVVIKRVQDSMLNLSRHGAVILCVTHKPHLFSNDNKLYRSITMCRGEILSTTC